MLMTDHNFGLVMQKVFDDGAFSEDSTFSITDWMAHVTKVYARPLHVFFFSFFPSH